MLGLPSSSGILVTDGQSSSTVQTTSESNKTHQSGIGLISVGVGPAVDRLELNAVASDPDSQNVFTVNNYDQLNTIVNQVMGAACKGASFRITSTPVGSVIFLGQRVSCSAFRIIIWPRSRQWR